MKIVVLVESSNGDYDTMANTVKEEDPVLIDTSCCEEAKEYRCLRQAVETFSRSDNTIMLARFSGNESTSRNLGDQLSEMILTLSDNKNSIYYTGCPVNLFSDIVNIFKEEI